MTDAMMAAVLVARAGRFLTTVTLVIGITGRAALFFGLFSGLKITFESWATLARVFRWRSLKDRAEVPS